MSDNSILYFEIDISKDTNSNYYLVNPLITLQLSFESLCSEDEYFDEESLSCINIKNICSSELY